MYLIRNAIPGLRLNSCNAANQGYRTLTKYEAEATR